MSGPVARDKGSLGTSIRLAPSPNCIRIVPRDDWSTGADCEPIAF